jgi:hypothetical protein
MEKGLAVALRRFPSCLFRALVNPPANQTDLLGIERFRWRSASAWSTRAAWTTRPFRAAISRFRRIGATRSPRTIRRLVTVTGTAEKTIATRATWTSRSAPGWHGNLFVDLSDRSDQ